MPPSRTSGDRSRCSIVVHTRDARVPAARACRVRRGFWQSVTGVPALAETPAECAARELGEETGLGAAGLARRARAARVSDLAGVALALCPGCRRATSSTVGISNWPEARAVRSSHASTSRILWLPDRARDRASLVVDESRGAAAAEGLRSARVIPVVTVHGLWMRGAPMRVLRRRLEPHGLRRPRLHLSVRHGVAGRERSEPRGVLDTCPATPCTRRP